MLIRLQACVAALAGLLDISVKGAYPDRIVWGIVALIFAILFFISLFAQAKEDEWPPRRPNTGTTLNIGRPS